jgi:mRNA-degrading endonuclease toxin of MazEF toxin-antitoxin module
MNRADVVIVEIPFAGGRGSKKRPALAVQNDHDNQRFANTVV